MIIIVDWSSKIPIFFQNQQELDPEFTSIPYQKISFDQKCFSSKRLMLTCSLESHEQ